MQDQATWNRLTLNLGVLLSRDKFIPNDDSTFVFLRGDFSVPNDALRPCTDADRDPRACTYRDTYTFGFSQQIQPRIGIAYKLSPKIHDKVYANFGRYSNMDNQSFSESAAPLRLYRTDAFFNLQTGSPIQQITRTNNTDKVVLPDIEPTSTDEWVAGYARPIGRGWVAEVYGIYRRTHNVFEDFPGFGREDASGDFRYGNIPAYRKYRGATLQVRKPSGGNWTVDASYTLSSLKGNWDLDYATSLFYTSSYIEDGPGLYVEDPNRTGTLSGSRTHVAKVFANYTFSSRTTVGTYFRVQNGRPWEAREFDPVYATDYQYAEPAGSRRTPTWTNFDLLVAQDLAFGPRRLRLESRLANVFNAQPALSVDHDLWLSEDNTDPNPTFGIGTFFARPRRLSVTATLTF